MKEHPILFSGPMVRAILDGRKTMTRRVVKPQPDYEPCDFSINPPALDCERGWYGELYNGESRIWHCPYGQPGDRLWVRETFTHSDFHGKPAIWYRADSTDWGGPMYWKPSIFMPRVLSRILLEVTAARVERVQDVDDTDAEREGCDGADMVPGYSRTQFSELWDSINAKRGYGWDANPWVWVIEFKKVLQ